eukprot:Em0009g914a
MTSEEATAFEEDAGDKYVDLNELFLEYDPDSSEMDSDNDASEENMKVRYAYLMPKESDVSVEFNSVKTLLFENQVEDISKTLHQAVNHAFTDGKEKLSYYDIEICLKTLFWLHFYRCSPTALFDKKVRKAYGPASDLSEELLETEVHEGYFL